MGKGNYQICQISVRNFDREKIEECNPDLNFQKIINSKGITLPAPVYYVQ